MQLSTGNIRRAVNGRRSHGSRKTRQSYRGGRFRSKVINVLKVKQVVLRFKAPVTVADVENVVTGRAYEKPR